MQFARAIRAPLCVAAVVASAVLLTATPASAHIPTIKAECVGDEARLSVQLNWYDGRQSNWLKVEDNGESIANKEFRDSYTKTYSRPGTVEHVFTVTVYAWDDPYTTAYAYRYPTYPYPYGGYGGYNGGYGGGYGGYDGGYNPYAQGTYTSRGWSFTKKFSVPKCVVPVKPNPPVVTTTTPSVPGTTTTTVPVTTTPVTTTTVETTTSTTTTTTPPLTFDWPTTRPKAVVVPAASGSDLPNTGANVTVPLMLGVLLLAGGIIVLMVLRRRIQN